MTPFVELKGVSKVFPGIKANDQISCAFYQGEIHALLGENGAGKSTLMNMIYGMYPPDEGEIYISGQPAALGNPMDAIASGIGMVHQHFMLIPTFTVAENIILGNEPRQKPTLEMAKINEEIGRFAEQFGFQIDPAARIQDISVGMQQKVEILKALYRGAEILILDEPTAVLTPQETEELGVVIRKLAEQGKAVVFITHKLKEVLAYSDKITVIRRGKVIGTLMTREASVEQLAEMMVGRRVNLVVEKTEASPGGAVVSLKDIHCKNDRKLPALNGLDLELRSGEIVGIAGIEGNGQSELVQLLTGLRSPDSGTFIMDGERIERPTAAEMIRRRISCIPEDRHRYGMVLDHSVEENLILKDYASPRFSRGGRLHWKAVRQYAQEQIQRFDIRCPSEKVKGRSLSGGNQQKVVFAREADSQPKLLIAAQPTRGLDVGAIEFVHRSIVQVRDQGAAVLLVSYELDEIMSLSDRVLVIYGGKIVGEFQPGAVTEKKIGILMSGGSLP